jgi:hypothetical protein
MEIGTIVTKLGSGSEWGVWGESPFETQGQFSSGSVWWFPSPDFEQAVEYRGPVAYGEMARWVHERVGDFDLAYVLALEPLGSPRLC